MALRNLLHIDYLDDFRAWLELMGWVAEEPKDQYQVLFMRHKDITKPLIVYKRLRAQEHVSLFGLSQELAKQFLTERKA